MKSYSEIADAIAQEIALGFLRPGERLPPQREFAYRRGIANSTAGRVYGELRRRGLVVGEVGRGTFVRAQQAPAALALGEPARAPVDMDTNYPITPNQRFLLKPALKLLAERGEMLETAARAAPVDGHAAARTAGALVLESGGWHPRPDDMLFAGNGRQALAGVLSALVPRGGRVGFEALTYPMAKALAQQLGFTPVPIAMDALGLRVDSLARTHGESPLDAVYLQPTLHNPLGITMPEPRREELARFLRQPGAPLAVEDRAYAFLEEDAPPPLAAHAPERVVVVDSLSKRIAPSLSLGLIAPPRAYREAVAKALVAGAWMAPSLSIELGTRWIADGVVRLLEHGKRADARNRMALARKALEGLTVEANPAAYHLILTPPFRWRAETFTAAAKARGIAITPLSAFAIAPGQEGKRVRLALGGPDMSALTSALGVLSLLARDWEKAMDRDERDQV